MPPGVTALEVTTLWGDYVIAEDALTSEGVAPRRPYWRRIPYQVALPVAVDPAALVPKTYEIKDGRGLELSVLSRSLSLALRGGEKRATLPLRAPSAGAGRSP